MNSGIKTLIIFAAGIGIGAGAGMYYTKTTLDKAMDAELDEVRNHYAAKIDELSAKVDNLKKTEVAVEKASVDISKEKKVEKKEEAKEIIESMDYNTISTGKKASKPKKTKKAVEPDIFVIEPNDFTNRDNGYDKVTLTYFEEDEKFLDDYDEDFADGLKVIGAENLDRFGEYEEGVLYVRNRLTETDYEVILEKRTYEEYMEQEYDR